MEGVQASCVPDPDAVVSVSIDLISRGEGCGSLVCFLGVLEQRNFSIPSRGLRRFLLSRRRVFSSSRRRVLTVAVVARGVIAAERC